MNSPLISCLCVTENRPEFMPWLLWNFRRQKYADKELVIVDSSDSPYKSRFKNIRVIHAPGLNIPAKRNLALQSANGELIAWMDDDDWYHPERLKTLAELITEETPIAGPKVAWFVNLFTLKAKSFVQRRGVLFSGLLARKQEAASVMFPEHVDRGSDLDWLEGLQARYRVAETWDVPSFFLCHDRNAGNNVAVHQNFNRELNDIINTVKCAWQETTSELEALRQRIGGAA